jgi:hypothetical protein
VNILPDGLCGLVSKTSLVFFVIAFSNALKLKSHSPLADVTIGAVTIFALANSI